MVFNGRTYAVEPGGTTPGSGHDQVRVDGAFQAGDTSLRVSLPQGYAPVAKLKPTGGETGPNFPSAPDVENQRKIGTTVS